jgi:vacuolar-type H+-ATPase subunit H
LNPHRRAAATPANTPLINGDNPLLLTRVVDTFNRIMPPKRSRNEESAPKHGATGGSREALCDSLYDAVKAKVLEDTSEELALQGQRAEEDRARLLADAHEAAAKVREDAEVEAKDMKRDVLTSRAALEAEKASMQHAHRFQTNTIILDVGGHKFTTSLQTLVSVPNTYFASLFSGRFELARNTEGAYFINRDGRHFHHVLNCLRDSGRFRLSSDVTKGQREELAVEVKFYGLLEYMTPNPYSMQECVGYNLSQRARLRGTKLELQTAIDQVHALVFEIRSTTPFLVDEFQDMRFFITDSVITSSPVWKSMHDGSRWFMYRGSDRRMHIDNEADYADEITAGRIFNTKIDDDVVAPTKLPLDEWLSDDYSTLESQYTPAERVSPENVFVRIPDMCITIVHGLDDDDPHIVTALQQLAALV